MIAVVVAVLAVPQIMIGFLLIGVAAGLSTAVDKLFSGFQGSPASR
jgi:hypothetical protein